MGIGSERRRRDADIGSGEDGRKSLLLLEILLCLLMVSGSYVLRCLARFARKHCSYLKMASRDQSL